MKHTAVLFFETNDYKTYFLLQDIVDQFKDIQFFVLWNKYNENSVLNFKQFGIVRLELDDILNYISKTFSTDRNILISIINEWKLFIKILLLFYAKYSMQLDYFIMFDNDIALLDNIQEIVSCSEQKKSFACPEVFPGANQSPEVSNFIQNTLGKPINYIVSKHPWYYDGGFNIGFCGVRLKPFDISPLQFNTMISELFYNPRQWWVDQVFIVNMMFTETEEFVNLNNYKYMMLAYNDPNYYKESKIYHAIYTDDKEPVNFIQSILHIPLAAWRFTSILDYVRSNYCTRILEIGMWKGDRSKLLIINSKNTQVEYHGIDLFEDCTDEILSKEVSQKPLPYRTIQANLAALSNNVFLHRGFSSDVFQEVSHLAFDVIWIDGGHSYETVKKDFELYSTLLSDNGVIFFDDYTEDPYLPDVKRYIDAEIMTSLDWEVSILDTYTDQYRGFYYNTVMVKRHKTKINQPQLSGGQLFALTGGNLYPCH